MGRKLVLSWLGNVGRWLRPLSLSFVIWRGSDCGTHHISGRLSPFLAHSMLSMKVSYFL